MQELTVLYDERCALCCRCRDWLTRQPTYVALRFTPLQSPQLERRYPGLSAYRPEEEIIAIGDDGAFYRGGQAWIMCLWATRTYREWSLRLATPLLFPMVKRFCSLVSSNRLAISGLLPKSDPEDVVRAIEDQGAGQCTEAGCGEGW